jgi:N-acetylmuramoyl-L-alanine amidase
MDVVEDCRAHPRPQKIKNSGTVHTVILDAGHGGIDSGATGPFGKEKDAALDVVLRAKKLLQESGYQVRCTRLADVLIPLEKRAAFANRHANAVFISVHFNKSSNRGASGLKPTVLFARRAINGRGESKLQRLCPAPWPQTRSGEHRPGDHRARCVGS